jgi:hypothetical protein
MSIWANYATIGPLYELGHGRLDTFAHATLDLSTANAWYGGRGIRVWMAVDDQEVVAVLSRDQVAELRNELTSWLDETES